MECLEGSVKAATKVEDKGDGGQETYKKENYINELDNKELSFVRV